MNNLVALTLQSRPAAAYHDMVQSMIQYGIPKLLILCLLLVCLGSLIIPLWSSHVPLRDNQRHVHMILKMSRLWNHEIPKSPRYDALDLFSGKGLVKAGQLHFCAIIKSTCSLLILHQDALCALGMSTAAHDLEQHPSMDVNKSAGFGCMPQMCSSRFLEGVPACMCACMS